ERAEPCKHESRLDPPGGEHREERRAGDAERHPDPAGRDRDDTLAEEREVEGDRHRCQHRESAAAPKKVAALHLGDHQQAAHPGHAAASRYGTSSCTRSTRSRSPRKCVTTRHARPSSCQRSTCCQKQRYVPPSKPVYGSLSRSSSGSPSSASARL